MKAADVASRIVIAFAIILPVVLIAVLFLPRALPWWGDGGDWLKRVNAILGNTYPMWNQTTLQYPPLFFVLVAGLSRLLGEILALKLLALTAYALVPLTGYFLSKELYGDRLAALGAAWLIGFTPVWVEMIGWGGYPDLLGLAFLSFGFYGILRFRRERSTRNTLLLAAGSVLIPLTHHLTFITFVGVLVLWGAVSLRFDRPSLRPIALSFLVTLSTFGLYRLSAGPLQFVLFNTAALSYLLSSGGTLLYMFKSWFLFGILYAAALGAAVLFLTEKELRPKAIFLIVWIAFPILATQGYLVGVAVDYNRVLFFFAQPFMILAAAPLIYVSRGAKHMRGMTVAGAFSGVKGALTKGILPSKVAKQALALVVVLLTLSGVVYTAFAGSATIGNVNTWYNSPNINPYGDKLALETVNYVHASTSPTSVIVANYPIGRWIEGVAQRRVMLELDPKYLFITGEVQREYAARGILESAHGIRNGYAWVLDQAPYGTYSPLLSFYIKGEYTNMVYVNDSMSTVTWVDTATGANYTRPLTNATSVSTRWAAQTAQNATLAVTYSFGSFQIQRFIGLTNASQYVTLTFRAVSNSPSVVVTNLSVAMPSYPGSGPYSATLVANRTLLEQTSQGPIYFYSNSFTAFPFDFTGNARSNGITGSITVWTGDQGNGTYLSSYDRSQLLSEYGVAEIVVPNIAPVFVPVGKPVTIERHIETTPIYQNLLNDPAFSVAYFNDDNVVLRAN